MKRKTIIISDLHLTTPDAQPQKLLKFLEENTCNTLILNGDIIDQRYLRYFGKRKQEYTDMLIKITQICKKNKTKMIYLGGNHEKSNNKTTSMLGNPKREIIITSNRKKYLICHGDNFERELSKETFLSIILFFTDTFFGRIDRNLGTNYAISHFLKRIYAFLTNQKTRFIHKVIAYAKNKKVSGIICGHLHTAEKRKLGKIHYLNSGDRTETCSALAEDNEGNRKILYAR